MRHRFFPLLAALAVVISAVVPSSSAFARDEPRSNRFWWPERLDLSALRDHDPSSNPYGEDFDYARAFAILRASKTDSKVEKNLQEALDKDVTFDPAAMPKAGSFSGGGLLGGLGAGATTTAPAEVQGAASPAAAEKGARPQPRPDYVPLDPYEDDD